MDLQKLIDDLIEKNPEILTYVEWVKYVPQGAPNPPQTTHTLKLASVNGADLVVALKAKEPYGTIADALLAVL